MFLPVAAVVPLLVYLWVTPWLPVGESKLVGTEGRVFLTGTLGGLPVVLYLGIVGNVLVRLRWKRIVSLGGLTLGMGVIVGGAWVLFDIRAMVCLRDTGGRAGTWCFCRGRMRRRFCGFFGGGLLGVTGLSREGGDWGLGGEGQKGIFRWGWGIGGGGLGSGLRLRV